MRRLLPTALVLATWLAAPVGASATIGGSLTVKLTFQGGCDVEGFLEIDNPTGHFVVFEHWYRWSDNQPVQQVVGSNPIADPGDRLLLRLFAPDHRSVLFASDAFTHAGDMSATKYSFRATLDCSTIPYRVFMSDTAVAPPRIVSGLTLMGWIVSMVAVALAYAAKSRQIADCP
jgi:hypothetical protein